jgi:hypothetical protein
MFDIHTNEVVGFIQGAFELDVIFEEMKKSIDMTENTNTRNTSNNNDENNNMSGSSDAKNTNMPELVRHYLVLFL